MSLLRCLHKSLPQCRKVNRVQRQDKVVEQLKSARRHLLLFIPLNNVDDAWLASNVNLVDRQKRPLRLRRENLHAVLDLQELRNQVLAQVLIRRIMSAIQKTVVIG